MFFVCFNIVISDKAWTETNQHEQSLPRGPPSLLLSSSQLYTQLSSSMFPLFSWLTLPSRQCVFSWAAPIEWLHALSKPFLLRIRQCCFKSCCFSFSSCYSSMACLFASVLFDTQELNMHEAKRLLDKVVPLRTGRGNQGKKLKDIEHWEMEQDEDTSTVLAGGQCQPQPLLFASAGKEKQRDAQFSKGRKR